MNPYFEIIIRSVSVYLFMVIALRIFGKKELSQLNTADVILILLISNSVQNAVHVGERSAKSLANGLMPQTHTQHAFAWAEPSDNVEQQSGFFRNSRSGRQHNFIVLLQIFQRNFVVPKHVDRQTRYFLDGMHQVVRERIVIIYDYYFHDFLCFGLRDPSCG